MRVLASRPFFGLAALLLVGAAYAAVYVPEAGRRGGIALLFISLLFVALAATVVALGYVVRGRRLAARRATAVSLLLFSPFPSLLLDVYGIPLTAIMLVGALQLAFRDTSQDWRREVERTWREEKR